MKLRTEIVPLQVGETTDLLEAAKARVAQIDAEGDQAVLRWGLVHADETRALLELATVDGVDNRRHLEAQHPRGHPVRGEVHVALVIPTGVGASVGGFVGDAGPVAQVLGALADNVVLHPNVVNGGDFVAAFPRSWYVDGLTLDRWLQGEHRIEPARSASVGLLLDRLPRETKSQVLTAANAVLGVHGIPLLGYAEGHERLNMKIPVLRWVHRSGSSASYGRRRDRGLTRRRSRHLHARRLSFV